MSAYAVGDCVLVSRESVFENTLDDIDSIVGPAPEVLTDTKAPKTSITDLPQILQLLGPLVQSIVQAFAGLPTNADKNHGLPQDMLPGDSVCQDSNGPGFFVGREFARFGAGEACSVEANSLLNRITTTTQELAVDTLAVSVDSRSVWGESLTVSKDYATVKERLGERYAGTEGYSPVSHRRLCVDGISFRGTNTYTVVPTSLSGVEDESGTPIRNDVAVASDQSGLDGTRSIVSAKRVELRKSLLIPRPVQLTEPNPLIRPKQKTEYGTAEDSFQEQTEKGTTNLNMETCLTANASKFDFPGAVSDPDQWAINTPGEADPDLGAHAKAINEPTLPPLGNELEYTLPQVLELTDPVTKEKRTYYAASSWLRLEDDGSINIVDGYGSEIRMSKGNIIISSSGDTVINPGRDLVLRAGRHLAAKGNKKVSLVSNDDEVLIKAETSLDMLGGAKGAGRVLLECRSKGGTEGNAEGLLLKSHNNFSLTGMNGFIGLVDPNSDESGKVAQTYAGNLIVDAGAGRLCTAGRDTAITGSTVSLACTNGNKTSALTLSPNNFTVSAETACISHRRMHFSSSMGAIKVDVPFVSGIQTYSTQGYPGKLDIIMDSMIYCTGSIKSKANIWGASVMGARMAAGNGSKWSGIRAAVRVPKFTVPHLNPGQETVQGSEGLRAMTRSIYQDHYVTGNRFMFPSSTELGINSTYTVVASRWQTMLMGTNVWVESALQDTLEQTTSMDYPGQEAWTTGKLLVAGGEELSLANGYKINA